MPIGFNGLRSIQSKTRLNGPIVAFTKKPQTAFSSRAGEVIFTATALATFLNNGGVADGGYTFSWYVNDVKLDTSKDDARIDNFANSSKLILTGLRKFGSRQKRVYCQVDYLPFRGEGKCINAPLNSNVTSTENGVVLQDEEIYVEILPELDIISQPEDQIVASGNSAIFDINSDFSLPVTDQRVSYQWQLGGQNLEDGEVETSNLISVESRPTFAVTSDFGDSFTIDWSEISSYNTFTPGVTYTLTPSNNITTRLYAIGGGGGASGQKNVYGSVGGSVQGNYTFLKDQRYVLQVGQSGGDGSTYSTESGTIIAGGLPGGGNSTSLGERSGGGGGYTALFINSVSKNNVIIIAGGGGGSAGDPATGGTGGGDSGGDGTSQSNGTGPNGGDIDGGGATQSAGGSAGDGLSQYAQPTAGSELTGGAGYIGGGGGAGYFGGGGGASGEPSNNQGPGSGGGGAGYGNPSLVSDISYEYKTTPEGGNEGSLSIELNDGQVSKTTSISGSRTQQLRITSNGVDFSGLVRCLISSDQAINTPVYSREVNYSVVTPKPIINIQAIDNTNSLVKNIELNLDDDNEFYIDQGTFGSAYDIIQLHSKEKDVVARMKLIASSGNSFNDNIGGSGGMSIIELTLRKNVEYTIVGVSNNSAVYVYEKSNLIAVVGQGGDAGKDGRGGDGGGVNVDGSPGVGRGSNTTGGRRPASSTLTSTGVYGSSMQNADIELYPNDRIAGASDGGRTISCSKGSYWINNGISPCEDNSNELIKFRNSSGQEISSTLDLFRGFKTGYTITETSGKSSPNSGKGGNGATGGNGGVSGAGGGGGSGYTSGVVDIIETRAGGNMTQLSYVSIGFNISSLPVQPTTTPVPLNTVTFNVVKTDEFSSSTYSMTKISGSGPDTLLFGPESTDENHNIETGTVYEGYYYDSNTESPTIEVINDSYLELYRYGTSVLTITPNKGRFVSDKTTSKLQFIVD